MSNHPDAPDQSNVDVAIQQQAEDAMKKTNGAEKSAEEAPIFVSREDRLDAENLHLRVVNLAHETAALQRQLAEKNQQVMEMKAKIGMAAKKLEEKYGINLQTHEIREEDGRVVPRTGANQIAQMMRNLGQA